MKRKKMLLKMLGVILLGVSVVVTSPSQQKGEVTDMINIGILQLIEHDSLDATKEGFIDGLAELGFTDGNEIQLTYLNAQGDQSNIKVMSQQLVSNYTDLVFAIATPAAQGMANVTSEIPIITGAVTDLVAANLVDSNDRPNTNVSGTSDMTPIDRQIELLLELAPQTKKIGFLYNSSEVNSQLQIEIAEEIAKGLGLETVRMTVTNTNDVLQNMQALAPKVDAIYIPTDNTLASAMATVGEIAKNYQLPVMVGAIEMMEEGGLATVGVNYYELGRQAAKMAVRVINGEDISTMPVELAENFEVAINEEMANAIGIIIPEE